MPDAFHELLNGLLNAPPAYSPKAGDRCRTRHSFGPWDLACPRKSVSRQTGRDGRRRLDREVCWADAKLLAINALQQQQPQKSERNEFMLLVLTV